VYALLGNVSAAEVEEMARTHDLAFFHLQGKGVLDKEGLLREAAAALRFPDYFGHNWDALEECLTDMSWQPAPGYLILCEHLESFGNQSPGDFETVLGILRDAASFWNDQDKAFLVILSDIGQAVPGLSVIEP
jgi:RNAse (barnase) inhibitor barstar